MEIGSVGPAFGTKVGRYKLDLLSKENREQLLVASKIIKRDSAKGQLSIYGIKKDELQLSYTKEDGRIRHRFVLDSITYQKVVDAFKSLITEE